MNRSYLMEFTNELLETRIETMHPPKGSLMYDRLQGDGYVDGWYLFNSKTHTRVAGPSTNVSSLCDRSVEEADLAAHIHDLDLVHFKNNKFLRVTSLAGSWWTPNLPKGWYLVNKVSKLVERGPMNVSQARLYKHGDIQPMEAFGALPL